MSLSQKYQAFLASPSTGALAEHASLHYIPTLTSITDATAIIKHLSVQEKLVKKKGDKILSAIEGGAGLSVDVETTLEFTNGGGVYLPGLDDNFLSDRTVTFPMLHVVHFDNDQKIVQMRQYWDQGSLLKQVEVIGARSRNWPIRDGKDQARLIATSCAQVNQPEPAATSRRSTTSRGSDEVSVAKRPATASSRRSTNTNAMNDPHATLSLFQPHDPNEEASSLSQPIAPRGQSAKPAPRELSELFVGEDPASPSPEGPASPQKRGAGGKSGAGKHYKPNRLWDEPEEGEASATPGGIKTNAKKYSHFEFGDGDEQPAAATGGIKTHSKKYSHFEFGDGDEESTPKVREPNRRVNTKHQSQWDFEDFVTPEKTKTKVLGQAVRHFGWSDNEDEESPVRRPVVHKARPDADAHFDFADEDTPGPQQTKARLQNKGNKGMGLYQDHVTASYDDDDDQASKGDSKRPLGDVTTAIKNENRQKDFGAHWEMTDNSPAANKSTFNGQTKSVPENQQKVLKGLDANWGHYEESPENRKIYKTAGNGMGSRKGTQSSWSLYEESPQQDKKENHGIHKTASNGMASRRTGTGGGFDWDF